MSLEGEQQQKIEHTGSRTRFSVYISALRPDQRLIYDFYDKMNSTNTINHLENIKTYITKNCWKRPIVIWELLYFIQAKRHNGVYQRTETVAQHSLSFKEGSYLNPNEGKINQQIKSDVCINRFYKT